MEQSPYRRAPGSGSSATLRMTPRVAVHQPAVPAPRTPTATSVRPTSTMPTSGSSHQRDTGRAHAASSLPAPMSDASALSRAFNQAAADAARHSTLSASSSTVLRPRSQDPFSEPAFHATSARPTTATTTDFVNILTPRRAPNSGSNRPRPTPPAATAFTSDGFAVPTARTPIASELGSTATFAQQATSAHQAASLQQRPNSQSQLPLSYRERVAAEQQRQIGFGITPRRLPFSASTVAPTPIVTSSSLRYAPSAVPFSSFQQTAPTAHLQHTSGSKTRDAFFDMLRATPVPRALLMNSTIPQPQSNVAMYQSSTPQSPYPPFSPPSPYLTAVSSASFSQYRDFATYRPMSSEPFVADPTLRMVRPVPQDSVNEEKTREMPVSSLKKFQRDGTAAAPVSNRDVLTFTDWWIEFHHPKLMFLKSSVSPIPTSQRSSAPDLSQFDVQDVRALASLNSSELEVPPVRKLANFVPWIVLKGYRIETNPSGGFTKSNVLSHSSAICTRHSSTEVSTMSGRRYALHGGPDAQSMKSSPSHWSSEIRAAWLEEKGFPKEWKQLLWKATVDKVREEMIEKGEIDIEEQKRRRSSKHQSESKSSRKRGRSPSLSPSSPSDGDSYRRRSSTSGGSGSKHRQKRHHSRSRSRSRSRSSSRSRSPKHKRRSHRSPERRREKRTYSGSGSRRYVAPASASMQRTFSTKPIHLAAAAVRSRSMERAPSVMPEYYGRNSSLSILPSAGALVLPAVASSSVAPSGFLSPSKLRSELFPPTAVSAVSATKPGAQTSSSALKKQAELHSKKQAAVNVKMEDDTCDKPAAAVANSTAQRSSRKPAPLVAWWSATPSSLGSLSTPTVVSALTSAWLRTTGSRRSRKCPPHRQANRLLLQRPPLLRSRQLPCDGQRPR